MSKTFEGRLDRRRLLRRAAALGLTIPALGLLGACGDDEPRAPLGAKAPSAGTAAAANGADSHTAPASTGFTARQAAGPPVNYAFMPNPAVPAPIRRTTAETVKVDFEVQEVKARIAEGAGYTFWTFNGSVPGPMIRVRQGDSVELSLKNREGNSAAHNIDLHAATGPGGGAAVTLVSPGETKRFRFKALNPGVYVYHCAVAPIPLHISNGMYGLIVVEPPSGLRQVDKEFYVCQGELYTGGAAGVAGHQETDLEAMDAERPTYVVFNGAMGSLIGDRALKARVGETVRIWFGVGGPNLTSSFHVIGEIFDVVATHGSLDTVAHDVQTVTVAPGGATMVEFKCEVPGTYLLVDHALSRAGKGGAGQLVVEGPAAPDIFTAL